MEVIHHFAHTWNAARHGADQVVLVAIIDAHIRIGRPDKNCIDAAKSLLEIIEVAVNRVFAGNRIIEISLLDHHLRLDKGRLRPFESRQLISLRAIANADLPLCTPMGEVV